jgi:bifunctional DNA-binding transcriptional regulator/antitoxin component of YhaV-PrlF toxin-antitoxin module
MSKGYAVAVVIVKSHYQMMLPHQIRAKARVAAGDLFEESRRENDYVGSEVSD